MQKQQNNAIQTLELKAGHSYENKLLATWPDYYYYYYYYDYYYCYSHYDYHCRFGCRPHSRKQDVQLYLRPSHFCFLIR